MKNRLSGLTVVRVRSAAILPLLLGLLLASGCSGGGSTATTTNPTNPTPPASNGSAVIRWEHPTSHTDGTPLNIGRFVIYRGDAQCCLHPIATAPATATSYTATSLAAGTHYFAVTVMNADGVESVYSAVVSKTVN